ncbi:MAG: hypothetical protein JHC95_23255 [Solirubrobacteraceae bacterium]|nr:hypothetical protein [Solirubrobacteraceae bacterium]
MATPLDRPRAPQVALGRAIYESHYLKTTDPAGGRALWIRQTALKRPGVPARGTLWATVFDREASAPLARRTTFDEPLIDPGAGAWARFGGAEIGPGHAAGTLDEVTWDLTWEDGAEPNLYLPSTALYDRPFPRSGGLALTPATSVSGLVRVADQAWEVGGWPTMLGHNWGSDHAAHWVWIHAALLPDQDGRGWVDLILARVKVGPALTPWIVSGAMEIDGERRRLGGPTARFRGFKADVAGDRVILALPGGVGLDVRMDPAATVTWDYAAPHGPGRDVRNCSVSDGTLTLPGGRELALPGAWALEVGSPAA